MKISQPLQKQSWYFVVAAGVVLVAFISTGAASDRGGIESVLRKLDAEWSATAGAKDLDKLVSYYSDDAVVLPPNKPAATTAAAIRSSWKEDLDSMVSGSWKATRVEVAKSGDMAYVSGSYEWTAKTPDGEQTKDHGKYLEVWEKQPDGSWKCGADCWNSDLPATPGNNS